MTYKKFENGDLFYNTIKAKPRFEFKIWGGKAVVNTGVGLAVLNSLQTVPPEPLVQPYIPSPAGCTNPDSFDFTCPENSYNIAAI